MSPDELLNVMKAYFAGKESPEVMAAFPTLMPQSLLRESLDVVDFIVYLEEELDREINIAELGKALVGKNFGDLSVAVSEMLAEG